MNKVLTWVNGIRRKKVNAQITNVPIRHEHKRIDVTLSVYARVDASLDMQFLLENSSYNLTLPEGCDVFRVELKEFVLN